MLIRLKPLSLALSGAALLTLAACGGGGDSAPEPVVPAPAPTTNVPVKVIDGAIKNALVCLDKNANNACDADETQGRTDASGSVTLAVPDADVGKYRVIAVVGTDAVDADSGPVTVAYTMAAPSDQTAVVSPLTTLVAQTAATQNLSTADAAKMLQEISGLPSVMGDYTQSGAPGAATAATVARTLVVTTQQQNTALAPAVGTPAPGGGAVTRAELDAAVAKALTQLLPQVVAAATDPAVQAACAGSAAGSAACTTAIQTQVAALAPQTGLTPTTLPVQVAIDRSLTNTTGEANTITAGGNLDWLNFTDTNNWSYRMFVATAAESTPAADGLVRFRELRAQNTAGTTVNWAFGGSYAGRDDMHFNGTSWANCPLGWQNTQTPRDDKGFTKQSTYCGYSFSNNTRTSIDVSGQSMGSVISTLRSSPYLYGSTPYTKWGTSSADGTDKLVLGTATFPTGSKLFYSVNTTVSALPGFDSRASNEIFTYSAAVLAGGDARNNSAHACNSSEVNASPTIRVSTLEQLIGAYKGTPCVFAPGTVTNDGVTYRSLDPNEWSGQSTVSIGTVGSAALSGPTATAYYTTNALIRVAFSGQGANAVTYYNCKQRIVNGSPRNCTAIGTGTYTIETLGDGRVMKFNNPPVETATLTYHRVFVERGGKVYWGYQDKPSTYQRARLNLTAGNALFTQIGIPTVTP